MTPATTRTARRRIAAIARRDLLIDTLAMRHSDSLDYHERHLSRIKAALLGAWEDGFREGFKQAKCKAVQS